MGRPSVRLVTPALSRLSYGCIKNPRTFLCRVIDAHPVGYP